MKSAYDASVEDTRAYYNQQRQDESSRLYFDPAKSGYTRAFVGEEGAPLDNQLNSTPTPALLNQVKHIIDLSNPETLASLGVTKEVVTANGENFIELTGNHCS